MFKKRDSKAKSKDEETNFHKKLIQSNTKHLPQLDQADGIISGNSSDVRRLSIFKLVRSPNSKEVTDERRANSALSKSSSSEATEDMNLNSSLSDSEEKFPGLDYNEQRR